MASSKNRNLSKEKTQPSKNIPLFSLRKTEQYSIKNVTTKINIQFGCKRRVLVLRRSIISKFLCLRV